MVPHIVFHEQDPAYSPGPELWGSSGCDGAPDVATSGLTHPPVLATAAREVHEAEPDRSFLEEVVPALDAWHQWLHRERSLDDSGLVSILHPWESADNAPRFDAALGRIEPLEALPFSRSDRRHLAAAERPTDLDYRRYVAIVEQLRACDYRPQSSDEAPFAYVDLCFNAIFAVAEADLAWLTTELRRDARRPAEAAESLRAAMRELWDEDAAAYRQRDLHGEEAPSATVADLFPVYAGTPDERQLRRIVDESLWSPTQYGPSPDAPWAVTTVSKSSPSFEPRRYWRGPVWVNVNWLLVRGLERCGLDEEAGALRDLTLHLVGRSGFSEYYDPSSGEPLGAGDFSWSAALTLDLLS
jgi:glycogen debranching enzyme